MYQLIHCHTLPKPFFQIFLFRIYAPTVQTHPHHIDPVFAETSVSGFHTSPRPQTPQTNPQRHRSTDSAPNQPHKPIHQRPQPHTTDTHTTTNSAPIQPHTQPHSLHNHTASTDTHRHATPQTHNYTHANAMPARPPPTLTTHREATPYPDVDAQPASNGLTVRPSGRTRRRSPDAVAAPMPSQPPIRPQFDEQRTRNSTGHAHTVQPATHQPAGAAPIDRASRTGRTPDKSR